MEVKVQYFLKINQKDAGRASGVNSLVNSAEVLTVALRAHQGGGWRALHPQLDTKFLNMRSRGHMRICAGDGIGEEREGEG